MKQESIIIILIITEVLFSSSVIAQKKYYGSITLPLGRVFINKKIDSNWEQAKYKMDVFVLEKIKTLEKSRCEITISDQNFMRIGEQTIIELLDNETTNEFIKVQFGKAWVKMISDSKNSQFNVRTPTSVCAIRGTVYRLTCDSIYTNYRVYEGTIAVNPLKNNGEVIKDTTFSVNAGEELLLIGNFSEYQKRQEKAIKDFEEEQKNEFENFILDQQKSFDEYKKKDMEAFRQFQNFHYSVSQYDREKDNQNDWVKWNEQRDEQINR